MNSAWDAHFRSRLAAWQSEGLTRSLRTVSGGTVNAHASDTTTPLLSFAGNDYLGLAGHSALIAAAEAALRTSGTGSRASPLVAGHREEHAILETALAEFKRAESALVFPSGFQASLATLGALAGTDDTILLDRLAHASLLDGAELSGARIRVFKHNDIADLKSLLDAEKDRRCLVVAESVYSMDGDIAPLAELVALSEKSGALLLVDEAHATGIMGPRGRGLLETVSERLPTHILALGTLSKALGSQGGYLCASKLITDCIVHAGRAFLFSTALAPASAAAANAALKLVDSEPSRRATVLSHARALRGTLLASGFQLPATIQPTPIIPILLGDETRTLASAQTLLADGILVPAIRYPTVKKGHARLRISLSAAHSAGDIERLVSALRKLAP